MRRALSGVSARGVNQPFVAVPELARGVSIPAPVEGWDAITPIAAMPETRAISMDNVFPQPGYVEIRKGHKRHNLTTGAHSIESLMAYHAIDPANDKLLAAGGTAIFDITTEVTATVSTTAAGGFANARFQHFMVNTSGGNFLWVCNGADVPFKYDGTNWTTASVSGSGLVPADIITGTVFKKRVWMVQKNKMAAHYLGTDAVQGTATPFDITGVFKKGGFLQAIGTWSLDGGDGPDDNLAMITSRGEVAVYKGTNPATDFSLIGIYEIGAPIGRRCLTKVGSDLAVVCIDGIVPLSKALIIDRAAVLQIALTANIQPVMNQSARDWKANFGWQLLGYPRGTRAILNVPVTENVEQRQYIMNTVTGAWCRFLDENANCWEVFQDRLYFGGNNGIVYEADCQGFDEGASIDFVVETAPNYCKNRGRLKQFTMCRALLTTDGQVFPGLALNVDFSRNAVVDPITIDVNAAEVWDVALWDGGVWPEVVRIVTDWVSVDGEGRCASIKMQGTVDSAITEDESMDVTLQINGWDMLVIDGAFL